MRWANEGCSRRFDRDSGSRILQLTGAATISNNIYGEQPYGTPDGKRIAVIRKHDFCFQREAGLLVCDVTGPSSAIIEPAIVGGLCTASWSGVLFYWTPNRELVRFDMTTLQREVVYKEPNPDQTLAIFATSPNQRHIVYVEGGRKICQLDIQAGARSVIFEDDGLGNSHLQYLPTHGTLIMVQQERSTGTALFVINADGSDRRYLPAGHPLTAKPVGHECFLGDTGQVLFVTRWKGDMFEGGTLPESASAPPWSHDDRHPEGNLFVTTPEAERPTVFRAPEYKFNHVGASRDGTYFVADAYTGDGFYRDEKLQSVALVIGNLKTGKYRALVQDTMASGGANQCTHTHPYFTADNRHVIFNADPFYSVPQVFAATVPEAFLRSLD